jgi:hypothetical protein
MDSQWNDVFNANLTFSKKGLYTTNVSDYYYAYASPTPQVNESSNLGENNLENNVTSSFKPPSKPLNTILYSDLPALAKCDAYLPTIINGANLTLQPNNSSPNGYNVFWTSSNFANYNSDECRQAWRLSNYIRGISNGSFAFKQELVDIAWNLAMAMIYASGSDGRLDLGINVYTLTASHSSYSGDMVPPLVALCDALIVMPKEFITRTDYTTVISKFKSHVTKIKALKNTNFGANEFYPILDSVVSGAQQLGLALSSFVCSQPFFSNSTTASYKYDHIQDISKTGKQYTLNTYGVNNGNLANQIKYSKELMFKGRGMLTLNKWGTVNPKSNYADAILANAYLTNIRIRGINIAKKDELSFGINNQSMNGGSTTITGNSYAKNSTDIKYHTTYVKTYYPMIGIPDSGWGACTMEIISYLGIVFAGLGDYNNFCAWHRTIYHLCFIQNGGSMLNWAKSGSDPITAVNNNKASTNYWNPEYLDDDPNFTQDTDERQLTIYDWPRPGGVTGGDVTNHYVNRHTPYRGTQQDNYCWSTPNYSVGYSPAWVAGGKTNRTDYVEGATPPAEALNLYFTANNGLYGATDADNNCCIAYTMAAKLWPTQPTVQQVTSGTINSSGYDCDVADYTGVNNAITNLHPTGFKNPGYRKEGEVTNTTPASIPTINITETIGYGITKTNGTGAWKHVVDEHGTRCTTWAYMADAIRKTMISKHGHASPYKGNFAGLYTGQYPNGVMNSKIGRVVTLGHDTDIQPQLSLMKLDYVDSRLYKIPATISCFVKGSKILGLAGYVAVEHLKVGDLIKTYLHGYRKIKNMLIGKTENNPNTNELDTIFVNENKLMLTGGHGILVDELSELEIKNQALLKFDQVIDGKKIALACYNSNFKSVEQGKYTYYNFVLENDDDTTRRFGIYANGLLCETPSEDYFYELKEKVTKQAEARANEIKLAKKTEKAMKAKEAKALKAKQAKK